MDNPDPATLTFYGDEEGRHPTIAHLLSLFAYEHLPAGPLRDTSALCWSLAHDMANSLGSAPGQTISLLADPEMEAGLRKLLEAKDCFVRQALIVSRRCRPVRTCAEAGAGCKGLCTVNSDGEILDPDCFR